MGQHMPLYGPTRALILANKHPNMEKPTLAALFRFFSKQRGLFPAAVWNVYVGTWVLFVDPWKGESTDTSACRTDEWRICLLCLSTTGECTTSALQFAYNCLYALSISMWSCGKCGPSCFAMTCAFCISQRMDRYIKKTLRLLFMNSLPFICRTGKQYMN